MRGQRGSEPVGSKLKAAFHFQRYPTSRAYAASIILRPDAGVIRFNCPTIALVVPSITDIGGVPSLARFVKETVLRSGRYRLKLVSLAMSSDDPVSSSVVAPKTWLRGVTSSEGLWEGLPFVHVGAVAGDFEFQRYRRRSALTRTLADCDLIQVASGAPAWANAVIGLGKPVALQVATRTRVERRQRDADARGFVGSWRKAMTEVTDFLDDRALRRADAIQVMNPWMLEYAQNLNSGREVDLRYAPPGVDADLFCPTDTSQSPADRYILCVARLSDSRKNIGLLLEAYARLPEALRTDVRLTLAGATGPPDAFWRRAEVLGVRERIGFVDSPDQATLLRLYQGADLFAFPSDEEGFGVVLLEAMACGTPAISTRSGGPDGIITDGHDGFLTDLGDAEMLTARLRMVLEDPELLKRLGRSARETIERRYDQRVAGAAFLDIWDRMMHKAGRV